jgi:hypothetical protein
MLDKVIKIGIALQQREQFECVFRCGKEFGCHCDRKMECMQAMAMLARKDVEEGLYD